MLQGASTAGVKIVERFYITMKCLQLMALITASSFMYCLSKSTHVIADGDAGSFTLALRKHLETPGGILQTNE